MRIIYAENMKAFIFDLDNTLYSSRLQVFPLIDTRINTYMSSRLKIPEHEVDELRVRYWRLYGVTMQGLIRHHGADPEDFLSYVHDLDLTGFLEPDPELKNTLLQIDSPRYIFTNATREHALSVLRILGLEDLFDSIFDIRTDSYLPKPFKEPYLRILHSLELSGTDCVMIDDLPDNLKTAKELGMHTVLVGENNGEPHIDCFIQDICNLPEAIRRLRQ